MLERILESTAQFVSEYRIPLFTMALSIIVMLIVLSLSSIPKQND